MTASAKDEIVMQITRDLIVAWLGNNQVSGKEYTAPQVAETFKTVAKAVREVYESMSSPGTGQGRRPEEEADQQRRP